jgi:phosphatidylserine decarboxylase
MDEYTWSEPPHAVAFPVAAAGYPLIGAAAFATLVLALLGLKALAVLGLAATFAIAGFFRDPDRVIPNRPGLVVSPADGKVIRSEPLEANPFTDAPCHKISVFMSVFDVHVNRVPFEGRVLRTIYRPGSFVAADRAEASLRNEHNAVVLETEQGRKIGFVQVAGLIARRIICRIQPGDRVRRGQRFGMICFGSRLDIYLPADTRVSVAVGDKVRAGTTVLGSFPEVAAGPGTAAENIVR